MIFCPVGTYENSPAIYCRNGTQKIQGKQIRKGKILPFLISFPCTFFKPDPSGGTATDKTLF
ncbi:Uncharacterized protein dnm_041640 [Desulfonema magnum]|uniref:Uncharacterized protein n=1 Tax=Desulfonema magnum TaxID=45655 RepID=A0A975GNU0_9BACT|nr:Uncharacterized protein dnm_041640 [Desulfonema magnum]